MNESLGRLAHDLRGPALTIQGFAAELSAAVAELSEAAASAGDAAEAEAARDELVRRVSEIVAADLEPCLECVASAATTLCERIDELGSSSGTRAA